jgi:hypothetical protein
MGKITRLNGFLARARRTLLFVKQTARSKAAYNRKRYDISCGVAWGRKDDSSPAFIVVLRPRARYGKKQIYDNAKYDGHVCEEN